jgi:hypothetical protein
MWGALPALPDLSHRRVGAMALIFIAATLAGIEQPGTRQTDTDANKQRLEPELKSSRNCLHSATTQ